MMRELLNLKLMTARLLGDTPFNTFYYRESELTRLINLFAHVDVRAWKGMRVLEVGAGVGRIGDVFERLGFEVTSTDGRAEFVERMRAKGRQAFVLDLNEADINGLGDFELVVAFGVLYHLSEPERFLLSCGKKARVLLLETAVCDSLENVCYSVRVPSGWRGKDQALGGFGCRPSPSWIEGKCEEAGFDSVRDISNSIANWVIGNFDWEVRGNREWRRDRANLRKMWVCEKTTGPMSRGDEGNPL